MRVKLSILTPVHIGSGNDISPLEYFVDTTKFYRLNMDSLFHDPAFRKYLNYFIDKAKSERYIGNILPLELLRKHVLYTLNIANQKRFKLIEIKEIIKTAGRAYIPGSSLKGSILSGILENVLYKYKKLNHNFTELLDFVLGKICESPDRKRFSRWLDVTDSNLKNVDEAVEISVVNIVTKRGRAFSIIYETLKEGVNFNLELKSHCSLSEMKILKIADEFYKKVYQKEKAFSGQILPKLPDDAFILRIGQGSTAYATSFLILAEELGKSDYKIRRPGFHKNTGEPISRKLISGTKSMGWVCIKPEYE